MRNSLPLTTLSKPIKVMLLGSGELGKEISIEAQRLGAETIAVDRYDFAPAMHVSSKRYIVDMMNKEAIKALAYRERPDVIIPEVEAISFEALEELEDEGFEVIPNSDAVRIAMNRIELRNVASVQLNLPTTRYFVAENEEEAIEGCEKVGYPCIIKPEMSSSGHGHFKIKEGSKEEIRKGYIYAIGHARGKSKRVIVEEFVELETELTVLVYRYENESGGISTETCEPVEHWRYGKYHYIESWQPSVKDKNILASAKSIAIKVANRLGGKGIFGVELFLTKDGRVLFSEVAPRPHDTGMVTMVTQDFNEFAIHVRAALGLPVPKVDIISPGASLAIYSSLENSWSSVIEGVYSALSIPGVGLRIFGKPFSYKDRRMALLLARGKNTEEALEKVRKASSFLKIKQ
ncbi:formate-dependent phosphoribosylglycinamide formyltransferase [Fervidicoccus fontis]|uniref:Formate-dependent phosphoribosylglycinamide formyltransferase n=1 Tax=Fervidicoccus fontis TaxID=683846 RepID=A0A7C2VB25_9CREN|nr:formate-dependent phosphoribosylglycinamide formyltransferase [Fervidicoccus fontis]PMB78153.1 MAG: formate-dependent phosphoribosylglycinamide formyltransferase [Fervidicoccus fontis]HEW64040.1 formate-dependent phosphoribosylglycinamide formyltransferase [Fervidicoccus fontis]